MAPSAHLGQRLQVQVNRPRSDGAAAGQRDLGFAMAGHQRRQHLEAGAHFAHHVIGGEGRCEVGGVEAINVALAQAGAGGDRSTVTPKLLRRSAMARTSARRGTLERLSFSDVSRQAAISFRAAFLAPLMGISPLRRAALRMRIRSIGLHWGRANGIACRVSARAQRKAPLSAGSRRLWRGGGDRVFLRLFRVFGGQRGWARKLDLPRPSAFSGWRAGLWQAFRGKIFAMGRGLSGRLYLCLILTL